MLTKAERTILYNQYEILKHLDPNEAKTYKEKQEILADGYEIFYSELNPSISDEPASVESCREVINIMDVFRAIHNASDRLKYKPKSPLAQFQGFDGNHEHPHYGFCRFLIDVQGRWPELNNTPRNSHGSTLPLYRKMLARWEALGDDRFNMTAEQIEQVAEGS
jgi:uncharacterized protein YfbU (UPF0304 family)